MEGLETFRLFSQIFFLTTFVVVVVVVALVVAVILGEHERMFACTQSHVGDSTSVCVRVCVCVCVCVCSCARVFLKKENERNSILFWRTFETQCTHFLHVEIADSFLQLKFPYFKLLQLMYWRWKNFDNIWWPFFSSRFLFFIL